MTADWTVSTVLAAAQDYLAKRKLSSPQLEAELLLAHSLNVSRVDLYVQYDRPLKNKERAFFRSLIKERVNGKPLQYITGRQPFRHLDLAVEPGVFIPRPETELLVEAVLREAGSMTRPLAVLELGTGSGAICLSLARELPGENRVWTVEVSQKALEVARANAIKHGLDDAVTFCHGDLFSALPKDLRGRFDVIIANPPYIASAEIDRLMPEVRDHEPREALDGGPTGFDFYRSIVIGSSDFLKDGGLIAFEIGLGQAGPVVELLDAAGFIDIAIDRDYNGIDRIITGRRCQRRGHSF